MLAPEEADPSRRASNEQPSEDVISIIQETRDDDRLPEEVSPLLDDSTIGQKAAAPTDAKKLRQAKQAQHGEGPVPCYRRPATRNLLLAAVMLAAVGVMLVEMGPDATQQVLGHNITLPEVHLPDVHLPPMPKIDWNKLPPILRPGARGGPDASEPLLYDPEIYPWARDVPAFLQTLENGKAAVDKVRQGLWDKRQPNGELIFPHVDMWNPEPLRRSMNRALLEQSEFVVGVMGTSVTAGHDNYFNQSFPVVWGRIMEEVFTAANVSLVMRNHAMGWNPIHPSYYCVGEIAGADADITLWEFGMMGGTNGDMEQWVRSSILLPKQPHVLLCDTMEGARDTRNGPIEKRTDPPPQPWVPPAIEPYRDAGLSIATTVLKHSYMFLDHTKGYDLYELYVRDKPTDRPASWHPGPYGHLLRAEILAYNYLGYLGEAIDEVKAFVAAGNTTLEDILPQRKEVPAPVHCQPELCSTLPACLTTFAPRAGPSLRTALVSPTESDKLPFVEDMGQAGSNSVKEWHEQLYSVDVGPISHMLQLEFNYLDRKWLLQGENAGPLAMQFESQTENYFMVCGPPGQDQHCNATNTKWTIDGAGIGCKFKDQSQKDGTPYVEPPCAISDRKIPAGKHKLELHKHSGEGPLEISHLIWF